MAQQRKKPTAAEEELVVPPQSAQPQFPAVNVSIQPDHAIFSIVIGPGLAINQILSEQAMNHLCGQWLETRRQIKAQLELVKDIQATKN